MCVMTTDVTGVHELWLQRAQQPKRLLRAQQRLAFFGSIKKRRSQYPIQLSINKQLLMLQFGSATLAKQTRPNVSSRECAPITS